jgi:predicted Zn-dependent protease
VSPPERPVWVVVAAALLLLHCAGPDDGKTVLMDAASASAPSAAEPPPRDPDPVLDTVSADRRVGEHAAKRVKAEMRFVDSPELGAYVNAIGDRLLEHVPDQGFEYEFHVLDQAAPNAFALPGGFVYVSRGLVILANSEDELANVLGHEITHVVSRHAAARQQVAATTANPMMLPGVILGTIFGEKVGRATTEPFRAFSAPYVASYSRDQERAADSGGQQLAALAGYNPGAMSDFLNSLAAAERHELGYSRLPSFMDTHPGVRERVHTTATDAQIGGFEQRLGIAGDRAAYLHHVDGLVAGQSVAEGYFEGERFFHPDLNLTLEFPHGWELVNTDRAVGAVSPTRDAQIFLSAPTPGSDPRAAAEEFITENRRRVGLSVSSEGPLFIGELPAYRIEARGQGLGGQITWIAYGDKVYRLTAVGRKGSGNAFTGRAQNTARSFRPLTAEECAAVREQVVRVVPAEAGEDLAALGERTGNGWDVPLTGVQNDIPTGRALEAGEPVKTARAEPYRTENGCQPAGSARETAISSWLITDARHEDHAVASAWLELFSSGQRSE